MELILIRHALPVRVDGGDRDAPADPGLTDAGRGQADALARWLSVEPIAAVRSSTMRRAHETAVPVAAAVGVEVRSDAALVEADHDATSYVPLEEMADELWADPIDVVFGGRDLEEFRRRVTDALARIASDHPASTVAVVCHGAVINTYIADLLGLTAPLFFSPDYTSMSRVLVSRDGHRTLKSLNEVPHLH